MAFPARADAMDLQVFTFECAGLERLHGMKINFGAFLIQNNHLAFEDL